MSVVAVYQDYVHNNGSLILALQDRDIIVQQVDAGDIIAGALPAFDAFIMPGGADLYYCEKLNGAGNAAIKRYVQDGGIYIGICAGAYYACASIDWNNGEIAGPRELAFIDAKAVGPIADFIQDGDISKSWYGAAPITFEDKTFLSLYGAGPRFENLKDDAEVIASYPDHGPAVIGKRVGKGRVLLASPHIEICADAFARGRYKHRNDFHDYETGVAKVLAPHNDAQNAFFDQILNALFEKLN